MLYEPPVLEISIPEGLPELTPVQETLYPALPPLTETLMLPFVCPIHPTFVTVFTIETAPEGWVMVAVPMA
jgi:hypothetical protein